MKHTQGEWEIEVGSYPNGYFLQTVVEEQEAEANAKLMAAAPELLKALQKIMNSAENQKVEFFTFDKWCDDIKAAIKKATE